MVVRIILCGGVIWTLIKRIKRLTSVEMKIFRRTEDYALSYYKRNKEILEELEIEPVDERLRTYSHIRYDM